MIEMTRELLEKIRKLEEKLGKGWMKEFEDATTADLLRTKADELGINFTDELAKEAFKLINSDESEELTEEELAAVAGGYRAA
jgi:bacteriocin-like protein